MAIDSAKSTSTTVPQAIKNRYYDELFLTVAEANLVHKQLGQKNRKIEQGSGGYGTGTVYWTRMVNFSPITAGQGEGVPTTAVSASAVNVTGSTAQFDAAASISDILAYTAMGDIMKQVVERLAYQAGLTVDNVIRDTLGISGTQQNATGASSFSSIPATGTLSIAEIKKVVRKLDRNNAMKLADGFYVAVAHPDAIYDLQSDTSTGGWMDANKYTSENATKLLKGEVGKLHGVRFLQSSNAYVRAASSVPASGSVYVTSVFGKDAFGVTELQGLKTYIKSFGSAGSADPTDKVATAGWKATFGAAVLDSSNFVNINHAVSSTA